jgi:SAM-dependent methyltransferase
MITSAGWARREEHAHGRAAITCRRLGAMQTEYTSKYYDTWLPISRSSAATIVPLIIDLVSPRSVVDVGCGSGVWLEQFRNAGIADIRGIDGPWVDPGRLHFPAESFQAWDLTQPIHPDRRFELAVSLEVAEHLPSEVADEFVASLVRLSPTVLFSAAIPGQGGANHVNEQWPEYWVRRFARHSYVAVDAVRPAVWEETDVAPFYAQNSAIFCEPAVLDAKPRLREAHSHASGRFPALVHPRSFEGAIARADDVKGLLTERFKRALGPARPLARRAKRAVGR